MVIRPQDLRSVVRSNYSVRKIALFLKCNTSERLSLNIFTLLQIISKALQKSYHKMQGGRGGGGGGRGGGGGGGGRGRGGGGGGGGGGEVARTHIRFSDSDHES